MIDEALKEWLKRNLKLRLDASMVSPSELSITASLCFDNDGCWSETFATASACVDLKSGQPTVDPAERTRIVEIT